MRTSRDVWPGLAAIVIIQSVCTLETQVGTLAPSLHCCDHGPICKEQSAQDGLQGPSQLTEEMRRNEE